MFAQLSKLSRWDKPIGTLLLYIPCQWGLFSTDANLLKYSALFAIGSIAMRGAGCTINDIWDIKFDKLVERTKDRPLASQQISISSAVLWSATQSLVGLSVLVQLPVTTQLVALSSVPLVILYPFLKRITYFPQVCLGLAFNYGALVGYSLGLPLDINCLLLFMNGWCWTMVYDTLYAHQDKADDVLVGVKSTALKFGDDKQPLYWLTLMQYGCLMGCHIGTQGTFLIYYATAAMAYQSNLIKQTDLKNPQSCKRGFDKSVMTGIIIALGLLHDRLYRERKRKNKNK